MASGGREHLGERLTPELSIQATTIEGVYLIGRERKADPRGYLERIFDWASLSGIMAGRPIKQVNVTHTTHAGTIRGLHVQVPPMVECKLVSCVSGAIFDVAVDLRRDSRTFGRWFGVELTAENGNALFVPEGCAHGMQSLKSDTQVLYAHTAEFSKLHEMGLHPFDPQVAVDWPLPSTGLSRRDDECLTVLDDFLAVNW
ncbi:MAG: dTDP-4-dehydrorhamnose 3,5-epimerase family protein [Candidatus Nanopelagicales bacterium]